MLTIHVNDEYTTDYEKNLCESHEKCEDEINYDHDVLCLGYELFNVQRLHCCDAYDFLTNGEKRRSETSL